MAKEKPGKPITKEEFKKLKKKYDQNNPGKTKSVNFGPDTFKRILANSATDTISIFFGEDDAGKITVMLAGIDAYNTILYDTAEDRGQPCPPYCPTDDEEEEVGG